MTRAIISAFHFRDPSWEDQHAPTLHEVHKYKPISSSLRGPIHLFLKSFSYKLLWNFS